MIFSRKNSVTVVSINYRVDFFYLYGKTFFIRLNEIKTIATVTYFNERNARASKTTPLIISHFLYNLL